MSQVTDKLITDRVLSITFVLPRTVIECKKYENRKYKQWLQGHRHSRKLPRPPFCIFLFIFILATDIRVTKIHYPSTFLSTNTKKCLKISKGQIEAVGLAKIESVVSEMSKVDIYNLAQLTPKGHERYCHHFASGVRL